METKSADLNSLRIDRTKREEHSSPPGRNKKLITWGIVLLIILVVFIFVISSWSSWFSSEIDVNMTSVSLQSPSQSDAVLQASGYVVAQRKASVASKGTGRLIYLGVVEGDKVKKDQIIARLDDSDIRAQYDEATANLQLYQAQLKEAENNFNRQKELFDSKVVSRSQLENAETNYNRILASIELAKAQIQSIQVALENMLIRAPFDGTVLTKNADVGEIVAPMAAGVNSRANVVTIADMTSLQVEADVSESNIQKITVGQDCEISLDAYTNIRYAGFVDKIVPTADRSKATVMVKVGFKDYDSKVLPEMSAKVLFLKGKEKETSINEPPILMVPLSAVVTREEKKVVYKVADNKAVEVPINTGRIFGNYIEVVSGVEDGDQVIDNPVKEIVDGVSVKVK
ncbi:MAG TPA: efflux RND transporter periplasmic adaptor subunit [Ignavibacteriaceae bacterium]|nr:efflux RND transporter periplasmic adaptor subunit [Ignavibacteriaceae bacterium]